MSFPQTPVCFNSYSDVRRLSQTDNIIDKSKTVGISPVESEIRQKFLLSKLICIVKNLTPI